MNFLFFWTIWLFPLLSDRPNDFLIAKKKTTKRTIFMCLRFFLFIPPSIRLVSDSAEATHDNARGVYRTILDKRDSTFDVLLQSKLCRSFQHCVTFERFCKKKCCILQRSGFSPECCIELARSSKVRLCFVLQSPIESSKSNFVRLLIISWNRSPEIMRCNVDLFPCADLEEVSTLPLILAQVKQSGPSHRNGTV